VTTSVNQMKSQLPLLWDSGFKKMFLIWTICNQPIHRIESQKIPKGSPKLRLEKPQVPKNSKKKPKNKPINLMRSPRFWISHNKKATTPQFRALQWAIMIIRLEDPLPKVWTTIIHSSMEAGNKDQIRDNNSNTNLNFSRVGCQTTSYILRTCTIGMHLKDKDTHLHRWLRTASLIIVTIPQIIVRLAAKIWVLTRQSMPNWLPSIIDPNQISIIKDFLLAEILDLVLQWVKAQCIKEDHHLIKLKECNPHPKIVNRLISII